MIDVLLMFINKIKKLIGTTNDTGGTSTSGTVMGKLNNIINNNSSTAIGNTTDTGGTATAGTVMGKLNGLFGEVKQYSEQMVTDNSIIKACTNYTALTISIPKLETEVLNVNGEGFAKYIGLHKKDQGYTLKVKVYIDGELFFDYGLASNISGNKNASFSTVSSNDTYKLGDFTSFVNGNTAVGTGYTSNLLHFKESLRVVVSGGAGLDTVSINYGLMG